MVGGRGEVTLPSREAAVSGTSTPHNGEAAPFPEMTGEINERDVATIAKKIKGLAVKFLSRHRGYASVGVDVGDIKVTTAKQKIERGGPRNYYVGLSGDEGITELKKALRKKYPDLIKIEKKDLEKGMREMLEGFTKYGIEKEKQIKHLPEEKPKKEPTIIECSEVRLAYFITRLGGIDLKRIMIATYGHDKTANKISFKESCKHCSQWVPTVFNRDLSNNEILFPRG